MTILPIARGVTATELTRFVYGYVDGRAHRERGEERDPVAEGPRSNPYVAGYRAGYGPEVGPPVPLAEALEMARLQ